MSDQRYFVARISGQEGPLTAAQVQDGLRSGRFKPSDLSWAEQGEHEWIALSERPELAVHNKPSPTEPLFDPPASVAAGAEPVLQPAVQQPAAMPRELVGRLTPQQWLMAQRAAVAWRRFLARSLDIAIPGYFVTLAMGVDVRHPGQMSAGFMVLVAVLISLAWIALESLLLSTVGNTPGKALLRLQVVNRHGERPHFIQALTRSTLVSVQGTALGIPLLGTFAQIMAFNRYTRDDRTAWDERAGTHLIVRPISRLRMAIVVAVFVGSAAASIMVATNQG